MAVRLCVSASSGLEIKNVWSVERDGGIKNCRNHWGGSSCGWLQDARLTGLRVSGLTGGKNKIQRKEDCYLQLTGQLY